MALAAYQNWAVDEVGDVQPGAQIEVRREDNGALPQLYADRDGATPLGNPITADSEGFFRFYVVGSAYKITISFGDTEAVLRHVGIGRASETDTTQSSVGIDPGFAYRFSDDTSDTDPTAGFIGGNDSDMSLITEFRLSKTDRFGNVHDVALLALADSTNPIVKGEATLARNLDGLSAKYKLLGVTDDTGFIRAQVAYRSGAESGFTLGDLVSFQSIPVGDAGINGAGVAGSFSVETFTGDGSTVTFSLSGDAGSLENIEVFLSGVRQRPTVDYTWSNPDVTFIAAPSDGVDIFIRFAETYSVPNIPNDSVGAPEIVSLVRSALAIPSGRITLRSGEADIGADISSASSVFYTPDVSDVLWVPTSSGWKPFSFDELELPLDSNSGHTYYHQAGKLHDLYVVDLGSERVLASCQVWSSSIARAAGYTPVRRDGRWVNPVPVFMRYGTGIGDLVSVDAERAAFVGTLYSHANGLAKAVFLPAHAAGGANNIIGICNAYNRRPAVAVNADLTFSWTNTVDETWVPMHFAYGGGTLGSPNLANRISFVDCFGNIRSKGSCRTVFGGSGHVGVAFNNSASVLPGTFINNNVSYVSTAAEFPRLIGGYSGATGLIDGEQEGSPFAALNFGRAPGLSFYQAMEFNDVSGGTFPSHTMTLNGAGSQGLIVEFQY